MPVEVIANANRLAELGMIDAAISRRIDEVLRIVIEALCKPVLLWRGFPKCV
jgi:hypothetical protein